MTDNKIIKALECCEYCHQEDIPCRECENAPKHVNSFGGVYCIKGVLTDSLNLINRQKADIERLNEELNIIRAYIHDNGLEWDLLSYSKRNGR